MVTPLRRLLLAFLCLCAAAGVGAASDNDLKPLADDSPLHGRLGALGAVVFDRGGHMFSMGTGFLITPCHVLTAAHVLSLENTQVRPGQEVRFIPSTGDAAVPLHDRLVFGNVVATSENFIFRGNGGPFDVGNISQDWALVELERPLPDVEPIKLLYPGAALAVGSPLDVVGYAAGPHAGTLFADERCPLWRGHRDGQPLTGILVADCAVRQGMSGGPVLLDDHGHLIAAGIVVERVEMADQVFTVAVPSRSFAERVAGIVRSSNVCAAGTPFATLGP